MHDPKSILFSFWHVSKLSLFWGVGFSPQTHIGFGQSEQPFGQFILHGQSKRTLGTFISKFSHIPNEQEVRALAHSVRQFELEHELAQSTYSSSHKPSHLSPISWSLKTVGWGLKNSGKNILLILTDRFSAKQSPTSQPWSKQITIIIFYFS